MAKNAHACSFIKKNYHQFNVDLPSRKADPYPGQ